MVELLGGGGFGDDLCKIHWKIIRSASGDLEIHVDSLLFGC